NTLSSFCLLFVRVSRHYIGQSTRGGKLIFSDTQTIENTNLFIRRIKLSSVPFYLPSSISAWIATIEFMVVFITFKYLDDTVKIDSGFFLSLITIIKTKI